MTAINDTLMIRWYTPRGQAVRDTLLHDLRYNDGAGRVEILASMRRDGIGDDFLDLRGIDLRGEDLANAQLPCADLSGARLDDCNLSHADLRDVRLAGASLKGAVLRGAHLNRGQLDRADLTDTDLTDAELVHTSVEATRMTRTRLLRATVLGVDFATAILEDVDLTGVHRQERRTTRRSLVQPPPACEPRPRSRRLTRPTRADLRPTRAPRAAPPPRPVRPTQRRVPPPTSNDPFDQALAALMRLRAKVGRITIEIDGEERVLFLERTPQTEPEAEFTPARAA